MHLLCMLHGITLRNNLLVSQLALQQAVCLDKLIFFSIENRFCVLAAGLASVCCAMKLLMRQATRS